jgi:cellobiose-specific phosphotransferase system component IIB
MLKATLSLVIMMFCGAGMSAQMTVEEAFRQENAQAFQHHFHSQVEMSLPGKENRYKKADAIALMEAFFSVHAVQSFKKVHSGASRGKDSNYFIGEMSTDKGVYRVYIYYGVHDGKRDIHELSIEKK